jgi:hypothetical protein
MLGTAPIGLRRYHVLRQRQVRDARAGIGGGDLLMDDPRRLRRRGKMNGFGDTARRLVA